MNNEPLWSRCSLGRNRWYWVVWHCFVDVCNDTGPIASGFAPSAEECETAALAVEPSAAKVQASWANSHHRKTCIQRRVREPASDSKQTVQQEYLYTDHDKGDWWDGTGDWLYSQGHRIVKVTKQSVFVEKEYWRSQIGVETYRLDRRELEENGQISSRQARERFFTKPIEESGRVAVTVKDVAVFLLLLRFFTNNMNQNGTLPWARFEALWTALYQAGDVERAFNPRFHRPVEFAAQC